MLGALVISDVPELRLNVEALTIVNPDVWVNVPELNVSVPFTLAALPHVYVPPPVLPNVTLLNSIVPQEVQNGKTDSAPVPPIIRLVVVLVLFSAPDPPCVMFPFTVNVWPLNCRLPELEKARVPAIVKLEVRLTDVLLESVKLFKFWDPPTKAKLPLIAPEPEKVRSEVTSPPIVPPFPLNTP